MLQTGGCHYENGLFLQKVTVPILYGGA